MRGPKPAMVTTITAIAPPMNSATPSVPPSRRKKPISKPGQRGADPAPAIDKADGAGADAGGIKFGLVIVGGES